MHAAPRSRSGRNGESASLNDMGVDVGPPGVWVGRGVRVGGCWINGVGEGPTVAGPGNSVLVGRGVMVAVGVLVALAT